MHWFFYNVSYFLLRYKQNILGGIFITVDKIPIFVAFTVQKKLVLLYPLTILFKLLAIL